jgi:hypothetical protein
MTSKRFITSLLASAMLCGVGMSSALAQYGTQPYPQPQAYPQPQVYPYPQPQTYPNPNTNTPGIDRREFQVSVRIDEGVRSGRISEHEAHRLHRWERDIERREALYKSDGRVTQQERMQLREELITLQNEVERLIQSGPRRHGDGRFDQR